jgi:UDP-2,4-diacetamido-2,4,6-trideoxy-beta-L-altropyranose hydrolase
VPLRVARPAPRTRRTGDVRVLVAMGGSDPGELTPSVVRALAGLVHPALMVETMANPAAAVWLRLVPVLAELGLPPARPVEPGALLARLALSDVAVLAFGVSVYEAMAMGVPTVAVCRGDDDAAHADTLAARGALLRVGPRWHADELRGAVAGLVADPRRRDAMREAAVALVDGRGAGRVAAAILEIGREEAEGARARA